MSYQDRHPLAIDHIGQVTSATLEIGEATPERCTVKRLSLIEIIKLALADLHDRRRGAEGYPHAEQLEETIRGWEDVLVWLKELRGSCVQLGLPPSQPY